MRGEGLDVIAAPGDAGDPEDAARMVRTACETLGGLDYLVNNAGTAGTRTPIPAHDFESQTESLWTKVFSVNLLGPFRCTVAAEPYLRDGGGAVVNTASVAAFLGSGSSSVYAASKSALINLTREHARAFGPEVRVNSISPGVVVSNWECQFERTPEFMAAIPMQRAGIPEDFAEAILFLCAGGAYITGENLIVDGGLMAGTRSAEAS